MTRVLITGMTSQQIHRETKGGTTVAGAMAAALESKGYTVTVGAFSIADELEHSRSTEYDLVFVGLGPLKGLGTAYMYSALYALYAFQQNAVLYVDDTSTLKIGNEFRAMIRRPDDFVKPFWSYKRDWALAKRPDILPVLNETIEKLAGQTVGSDEYWPFLVPSWKFDLAFAAGQKICGQAAERAITFDPSIYFGDMIHGRIPQDDGTTRDGLWGTTWNPAAPAVNRMGVRLWDVELIPRGSWDVLRQADGVLIPHAAWAPEALLATQIGVPVAADWRTLGPLFGEAWEALPANIEILTDRERTELAHEQARALIVPESTKEGVASILDNLAEKVIDL